MIMRVLGMKEESHYGVAEPAPDFHQEMDSLKASLNAKPVTRSGGSRMKKKARAGVFKPTSTVKGDVDLKRIGHYLKAFLGNYKFNAGSTVNTHEFWGGEKNKLPSFTLWETFDYFEKVIKGAIMDSIKLECSDESLTLESEFSYKTETSHAISEDEDYALKLLDDDWPVMFYDILALFGEDEIPGVVSSFSLDAKNNLNVDKTIGFGNRGPQRKAAAQGRDLELSIVSTLEEETLDLIQEAEYGEIGHGPSKCKLVKIPFKMIINICENTADNLIVNFPECVFSVEYEASGSEEIETNFKLTALGSGKVTLLDGTEVYTDMYCQLLNDMPKIASSDAVVESEISVLVKEDDTVLSEVSVSVHNRSSEEDYELEYGSGVYTGTVPLGRYDVIVEGKDIVSGSIINVTQASQTFNVEVE